MGCENRSWYSCWNDIYTTPLLKDCPICGNKSYRGNFPCSDVCEKRQRIRNKMIPTFWNGDWAIQEPDDLRIRIKQLEHQLKNLRRKTND